MIIKKIENKEDNSVVIIFNSSNVLCSKYKYDTRQLVIIFSSGRQYLYNNVVPYHYNRFIATESTGKGVKEHIMKNYSGSLVNTIDVEAFKKEFGL